MLVGISSPEIERALRERQYSGVRDALNDLEPPDVAEAIEELGLEDRAVVFRLLRRAQAADVFEYLPPDAQEALIKAMAQEQVASILNDMSPDDRTQLLEELPAAVTKQALGLLNAEERQIARQLLGYPEDSVGRLMTPDFIAVHKAWTVQSSMDHIRQTGHDSETVNVITVVDDQGKLIDTLRMRQMIFADPQASIGDIIDANFIALKATDDQEEAVQVFKEYDRVAVPVTDSNGILLGIVTVDDVLDVAEEEATEDIQKIGGVEALEHPYMQVGFWTMIRKRGGWLMFLFLGQLLTLNAMGLFADRMAEMVVLVMFVPLIISSGGNSGSQAATLVIRALALEEVEPRDWWNIMRREIMFGLSLGLLLSGIGFLRIAVGEFGDQWMTLSLVVGLTLICVVLWGVLLGSMLPLILSGLGIDPATSSTPFVATIADVTGLVIYLALAAAIL